MNYEYICVYVASLVLKRPKSTYLPSVLRLRISNFAGKKIVVAIGKRKT